ncbi:MAG: DNA polymerase III subunit delta [Verrucomicrobia bacterium]|nr:DNA polymerase III subunit delta [Verrucomicrobiota bacterium]
MARAAKSAPAKAEKSAGFHAVIGSDDGAVKEAARRLAETLAPVSLDDISTEIIDGAVDGSGAAQQAIYATINALQTPPFFGGEKFVWLKSASFLADTVTGRSNAVLEALEGLAEVLKLGLSGDTRFLVSAVDVDKRRSFVKTLTKLGTVQVFDRIDSSKTGWEEGAARLVEERADVLRLRFEEDALQLFTLFTGGDSRVIANELEKIDLYLGANNRRVTLEAVRLLVSRSRAGVIFELGSAVQERDLERALELLSDLLADGETPIGILLVAIVPTVRNLLLARDLLDTQKIPRGFNAFRFGDVLARLPEEATAHLPRKKDGSLNTYGLGFAAVHAHRYSLPELRSALKATVEANVALVTTGLEPRVILEQLLVKVLGRREG